MDTEVRKHTHTPTSKGHDWKIGFFLAIREIRRANKWTTALIVAVMVLTFLNLVVISGLLVGLIQGSIDAHKERMAGDVVISTLTDKTDIERSHEIESFLDTLPEVKGFSTRYIVGTTISANYERRTKETDSYDKAGATIYGVDPAKEDEVTKLSTHIIEGEYLEEGDNNKVLIGANLLKKYLDLEAPGISTLKNVEIGSKIRLKIGDISREVYVKGIIKSKVDFDQVVVMLDSELKKMAGITDNNANQIAVRLEPSANPDNVKAVLIAQGFDGVAKVQSYGEALPKFIDDMKVTFALLGSLIGGIGIAVASITIFIIIFVNAITRRKYIGIMKGIGIRARVIEISYIFQSLFYALFGTVLGSVLVFAVIKPYFDANPINFPFSDGIIVAEPLGTLIRALVLLLATIIAGYIPARIVVKQNTLDAILGR